MRVGLILSNILVATFSAVSFAGVESATVVAQSESSQWRALSFSVENDYGFSDRYYTNGLKFSYTKSGADFWTSRLQFAALNLIAPDGAQAYESVSVGQAMYVPTNINQSNPPAWDRPYAGWLYAGFGSHLATVDTLDSFTVNLGVVGPLSLAEDAQKFYHSIIGADWPMGWHYQIKNEPGIVLAYRHSQRILRGKVTETLSADTIVSGALDLGNVVTQGEVRTIMRMGWNLPYNFEANRIDYSSGNDVQWRVANPPNWHFYGYAGADARFVGYDITLNGNTFADSRSVVPKWLVGEFIAGLSARYESVQFDMAYTLRTAEFNNQKCPVHMFWTATFKYCF